MKVLRHMENRVIRKWMILSLIFLFVGIFLLFYLRQIMQRNSYARIAVQRIVFRFTTNKKTDMNISIMNIFIAKFIDDSESYKISEIKQLTDENQSCYAPAFSLDGKYITFYELENSSQVFHKLHSAIYTMQVDGSDIRCLSPKDEFDTYPVFTPNNQTIVFVSNRNSPLKNSTMNYGPIGFGIYAMKADGSELTQLTHPYEQLGEHDDQPVISPNGRYIVYVSYTGRNSKLKIMNIDGTGDHVIVDRYHNVYSPHFSPNGKYVYFSFSIENKEDQDNIAYLNLDDRVLKEFPMLLMKSLNFTLSPYGKRIIYLADDNYLHSVQLDGFGRNINPIGKVYLNRHTFYLSDDQLSFFPFDKLVANKKILR